jgi:hypothetical protein
MAYNGLRYGIKEVADVKFYPVGKVEVGADGKVTATANPVLEMDTLKVSNIEFTGEQSEARGGKGNAPLIIWDYGREINVTLEDALLSTETLNIMFGEAGNDGHVIINANSFPGTYAVVGKTFARDTKGDDRLFTFYIPKAKIQSENTLTMEAEGDPTVFNMSLRVLSDNGKMMELILDTTATITGTDIEWDTAANVKYAVTFTCDLGSTTQYLTKGSAITVPDAYANYDWTPKYTTGDKVTGNANYVGTPKSST